MPRAGGTSQESADMCFEKVYEGQPGLQVGSFDLGGFLFWIMSISFNEYEKYLQT